MAMPDNEYPSPPPCRLPPTLAPPPIVSLARWIGKHDEFVQKFVQSGKKWEEAEWEVWEVADWEVFQLEYFKASDASTFVPELTRQLGSKFFLNETETVDDQDQGIVIRVVGGTDEDKKRREAVTNAALALKGEVSRNLFINRAVDVTS